MKPWYYVLNQFLSATDGSYRSMRRICNYTRNRLAASSSDVYLTSEYTAILPYMITYNTCYETWITQQGLQLGESAEFIITLKELKSDKIGFWDRGIQNVYPKKTGKYIALLPHNHGPFQNGSYEDIMTAVSSLSKAIGTDPLLQTVKTDIDTFNVKLKLDFDNHVQAIGSTSDNSDQVEAARVALATELYGLLGGLMKYYKATPDKTASFFDLQTIRNHEQTTFKSKVLAGATVTAFTHTFDVDEQAKLFNRGDTILRFALSSDPNGDVGVKFVELQPHTELVVLATDMGAVDTCHILRVHNMSNTTDGSYTIMLL